MGLEDHRGHRFLGMALPIIMFPVMFFLLASAEKDMMRVPELTYVEPFSMKITYRKGVNLTLYVCCNSLYPYPPFLPPVCSDHVRNCDDYVPLLETCETKGQEVRCEIKQVEEDTEVKAYVAYTEGNTSIPLSKIASLITNKSECVPNPVSNLSVTTNEAHGLNLEWSPPGIWKKTLNAKHTYIAECQPLNNNRAKAVRKSADEASQLTINSQNITAATKYTCCVLVENVLTSLVSEPLCQNVTTTEKAPSSSPVILCGRRARKECPSKVLGRKRNITVPFKLPSHENQNGKIIRSEVYYRKVTSANFTKLIINGSMTEAVIREADTDTSYEVVIKSCTKIGCSPISNTSSIPALNTLIQKRSDQFILFPGVIIALLIAAPIILMGIVYGAKRHRNNQRLRTLPNLKPQTEPGYAYPVTKGGNVPEYHELEPPEIDKSGDGVIIVANNAALAADIV